MLPEMIGAEEFLGLVAFPELVHVIEVLRSYVPIRGVWKLLTTVPTDVCYRGVDR